MPPYLAVAADLRRRIESGDLAGKLPSARELAEHYGVASNTAAKAVRELQRAGLVATKQGWGSWVVEPGRPPGGG